MARPEKIPGSAVAAGLTKRQLIELLACARCGECREWCPVYAQDRRENITARGKIDALRRLVDNALPEDEQKAFLEGLYECSACGQCHIVCPVRINTPELWEQARLSLVNAGMPQPGGQIEQLAAIRRFDNPFRRPQSERTRWAEAAWKAGLLKEPLLLWKDRPSPIVYFAGCMASFDPVLQPIAVQSARLLQEAGVEFSILGEDEPCCMSKLRRMGDNAFAEEARKRADQFTRMGDVTIVVSCAGCFKGLHSDYATFWPGAKKVVHLSQFLDLLIKDRPPASEAGSSSHGHVPRSLPSGPPQPGLRRTPPRGAVRTRRNPGGDAPAPRLFLVLRHGRWTESGQSRDPAQDGRGARPRSGRNRGPGDRDPLPDLLPGARERSRGKRLGNAGPPRERTACPFDLSRDDP